MNKELIDNLEEILKLDYSEFREQYGESAEQLTRNVFGNKAYVTGILALSNFCFNDCLYCGLRSESKINRFRLTFDKLKKGVDYLESLGIKRILLISGEDPLFSTNLINEIISYAAERGFYITLGAGVFDKETLRSFYTSGAREFCLKFETSSRNLFRSVKPSSDYDERIKCLNNAAETGFSIATGNIIGLTGQTLTDVVNDIKYTLTFAPSWIPIVPYLPAPGTPMAEKTPMGDVELTLKTISVFRLLLENTKITAGQPSACSKKPSFADPDGNAAAIKAGANIFFVDATPAAVREDFSIVGGRALAAHENLMKIFADNSLEPHS